MNPHASHAVDANFASGPGPAKGEGFEYDAFVSSRHVEPDRSCAILLLGATGDRYLAPARVGLIDEWHLDFVKRLGPNDICKRASLA
jgi:hypothetical protein